MTPTLLPAPHSTTTTELGVPAEPEEGRGAGEGRGGQLFPALRSSSHPSLMLEQSQARNWWKANESSKSRGISSSGAACDFAGCLRGREKSLINRTRTPLFPCTFPWSFPLPEMPRAHCILPEVGTKVFEVVSFPVVHF